MATPKVYVICDQNCKFESMTKEQILAAIMQAVNDGTIGDVDAGFITTVKTINGLPLRFFYGEQYAYDALSTEEKAGVFAIITNDTTKAGILKAIEDLQKNYTELTEGLADGRFVVKKAEVAASASVAAKAMHLTGLIDVTIDTNTIQAEGLYAVNCYYSGTTVTMMLSIANLSVGVKAVANGIMSGYNLVCWFDTITKTIKAQVNGSETATITSIYKIAEYTVF